MPSPDTDHMRLLLVGSDPSWRKLVEAAAARLGAETDVVDDIPTAIAWMLQPGHSYERVLASLPLGARDIDTLVGLLDELTVRPTRLLLLGCTDHPGATDVGFVPDRDLDALCRVLQRPLAADERGVPAITADDLIYALHAGGLRMRFQPILSAKDLKPIGLEALARVHTRRHGVLHPKDFIPTAIACGRERVLTGIAASRTFLDIGRQLLGSGLFVSLNLPLNVVMHEGSLLRGAELCAVAGVSPTRIMVEVLESQTAPDLLQLRAALDAWRGHGFKTAIDDAGPALPHWRDMLDLPFDVLKLDGTLVSDLTQSDLLETIIHEGKRYGRFIIAEGIENEACLSRILALGVDAVQGFMFSRPLPAMAVPVWLKQQGFVFGQTTRTTLAA